MELLTNLSFNELYYVVIFICTKYPVFVSYFLPNFKLNNFYYVIFFSTNLEILLSVLNFLWVTWKLHMAT